MLRKVIVGCIVPSLLLIACGKDENPQKMAPLVSVVKSIKTDVPWKLEYPAQVAGSLEVEIRAQVGGILKERSYEEGEFVEKDSVLFTIDPQQYQVALDRAKASLEQVNTEVQKARRDYNRMAELIVDNAVSQKDYDDALSALERAQANYKAEKAIVDDAKINLGYTQVKAPIAGIARKENHSVGSLISTMGDESLLTTMVQINPLYVNFSIPGRQLANLKMQYDSSRISIDSDVEADIIVNDTIYKEPGKIIFFDSAEDPKTSAIAVKVEVANPDSKRDLNPGQFVKVRLRGVNFKDAVIVPQSSVLESPKGNIVYVVTENGTVDAKPVTAEVVDNIAVVYSGLEGGETVVSDGLLKLKPGAPVKTETKDFALPEKYQTATSSTSANADEAQASSSEQK